LKFLRFAQKFLQNRAFFVQLAQSHNSDNLCRFCGFSTIPTPGVGVVGFWTPLAANVEIPTLSAIFVGK